jgi:Cu+-exporting ATPase
MSIETVSLPVSGMTCGNCARTVERKLATTPGVFRAQVNLAGGKATVEYDPARTNAQALAAAVESLGYQVPQK